MAATGVKKGIALIMLANLINLIIGLVNGFVIPKFLSVESYAMIKTFTLYGTYAGFFHLGYLDGMYLKYGGKRLSEVSPSEYGTDFWNVSLMQVLFSIIVILLGVFYEDFVLSSFGVVLFFRNIASCFSMFFQATGEFKLYSSILNYGTILSLFLSLVLIFIIKTDNYRLYISAQVFSSIVITLYLALILNSKIGYLSQIHLSIDAFKENISSGFVLMLGNFSNNLFTSIDRWIIKIFMTTLHFAAYSFAASVDSLITVFITPLYITLYNEFCKDHSKERIIYIKKYVLLWGCIIVLFAFPAKWVVQHYMVKYEASISLVFVLASTQVFYAIIKGVYVNYFKALKQQKAYFFQILLMLAISVITGLVMYFVFKSMLAVAFAALVVSVVWLIINEVKFKEIRFKWREWMYLIVLSITYLYCGLFLSSFLGGVIYMVILLVMSFCFLRPQVQALVTMAQKKIFFYIHRL